MGLGLESGLDDGEPPRGPIAGRAVKGEPRAVAGACAAMR